MSLALAWAMGLRGRWLVLGLLGGLAPDLDHLPLPGLVSRGTTTNVIALVVLPMAAFLVAHARGASPATVRFLGALPAILLGHLVLDLFPIPPGGATASAALFYPFDARKYTVPADLLAFARTLPFLVGVLALALLGLLAAGHRALARGRGLVFALALFAVLPLAAAAGALTPSPARPNALVAIREATYDPATGNATALVLHEVGAIATISSLRIAWHVDGALVKDAMNPIRLTPGAAWTAARPLAKGLDPASITVRLVAVGDGFVFDEVALR